MAGPTHASANFDPIVSLVMSLLAPPAVRSNRIAQTSRTTARDRFLAGGSPVQIWVARITAKWDKNNRTAWEALSLNRLLSGSVFRRGLPLPHEIRRKAIIPSTSRFCGGSDQDRPVNCREIAAGSRRQAGHFAGNGRPVHRSAPAVSRNESRVPPCNCAASQSAVR